MVNLRVDNLAFTKALPKAVAALVDIEQDRVSAAAQYLKSAAIECAPSDTGALRAHMLSQTSIDGGDIVGVVGNDLEYAPYVHQGTGRYAIGGRGRKTPWRVETIYKGKKVAFWTVGIKPQPFLKSAVESSLSQIKRLLGVSG